ncbi:GNAT family N-acetyltransferase [Roseateles sp. DAIF2]|uniref:GNAT family N-acetyltransferase n=1 Tax=Roseateles sp. DAIF2 TaxID=2714952 RepID=UPI0018A334C3|nr:GNAT family N-acetyltransferase [Roseateles sp. DAIF2]QPF76231.1 GNAT family N-acetyltransferase [Roseateles sp. DAIF2]
MKIRPIQSTEYEDARKLLSRCGWTRKVEDPAIFGQAIRNSQIALVAEIEGRIVGFLRAITDGTFNGYLSMLAVDEEYRGRGIGSALVAAATGTNPDVTWVLRADRPGVSRFYQALGFKASEVAMEKKRSHRG